MRPSLQRVDAAEFDDASGAPGDGLDEAAESRERTVLVNRLQIFNRNHLPILLVHLVLAVVVTYAEQGTEAGRLARWWLLAIVCMVAARLVLHRRIAAERAWTPDTTTWIARGFVAASATAGALWGLTAPLFYLGGPLEMQFVIVVVLTGMGAGAVTSLIMYMPAFYAFLLPSLLPMSAVALLQADTAHLALGVATLVYALALCYFGRNFSRALVDSLALRYENVDLVTELRHRTRLADEANAAKSRFVAMASHDLRQPVHALALFVDALRNGRLDERAVRISAQIDAAVAALDRMFSSLLDISQLESGAILVEREAMHLPSLVDELVNEFAPQARDKGLALRVEGTDCWVGTDRALLERILRNLIANAVRYTEEGEVTVRIHRNGQTVRITVADTGPGIASEDQAFIFEEFRKLDNADRDPRKGLGLGLAIVKRAADLLETGIEVQSAPGVGTEFHLELPEIAAPEGAHALAAVPASEYAADELAGMRVLVVDDDPGIRRGMRTLLHDWGCEVTCSAGHDEAVRQVQEGYRPQVLIADLHLTGSRSGLDTVRALRARLGDRLPAVIVTGEAHPVVALAAGEAPVPVLQKPAPPPRIRSFLRSVRRQRLAVATD